MKKIIFTIAAAFIFSAAYAGPFGIEMGVAVSGLKVKEKASNGLFILETVPAPHPYFPKYAVFAAPNSGVFTVKAAGANIMTNVYGSELKSEFEDLVEKLSKKYGNCKKFDYLMAGSIWKDPKDFMTALLKQERVLSAYWTRSSGSKMPGDIDEISLTAHPINSNKGYIAIQYNFSNTDKAKAELSNTADKSL